jgi:hypothetical protein
MVDGQHRSKGALFLKEREEKTYGLQDGDDDLTGFVRLRFGVEGVFNTVKVHRGEIVEEKGGLLEN